MTTEQLIEWVDGAISVREDSYVLKNPAIEYSPGYYTLDVRQALVATKPKEAKEYDFSIAMWMIGYPNDVTDWMHQINFEKLNAPEKQLQENITKIFKK